MSKAIMRNRSLSDTTMVSISNGVLLTCKMCAGNAPADFSCEYSMLKFSLTGSERHSSVQWDVVNPPIPDRGIDHSI